MPPYSPPPSKPSQLPSLISSSSNAPTSRRPYPAQSSRGSNFDLPSGRESSPAAVELGDSMSSNEAGGGEDEHFAWSTTLRRAPSFHLDPTHHSHHHHDSSSAYGGSVHGGGESAGLLERLGEGLGWGLNKVGLGGSTPYERVAENGGPSGGKEREETPSEIFARLSVEVSPPVSSEGGKEAASELRARPFPSFLPALELSRNSPRLLIPLHRHLTPFPVFLSLPLPPGNALSSPPDVLNDRSPVLPPPPPPLNPRTQRVPGRSSGAHSPQVRQTNLREPPHSPPPSQRSRQFDRRKQGRRDQYRRRCLDRSDG